jgi:SAM-dependent methyltransferase
MAPVLCGQDRRPGIFADDEAYEQFMGRWSRLQTPQLVDFTDVPDRGWLLDVGSGTGALAFALAERKTQAHVQGIDLSKEYVAYANGRNAFPDRISFEAGDAQQLHFADASFDASLSLLVFNFIPDPRKAYGRYVVLPNPEREFRPPSGTTEMGCGCSGLSGMAASIDAKAKNTCREAHAAVPSR